MKRLFATAGFAVFLSALTAGGLWYQYRTFLDTPLKLNPAGEVLMIQRGSSVSAVLTTLESRSITQLSWKWRLLNRMHPVTIMAGEYALPPGISPPQLLALLASGKVITYRFTIVEGWSLQQMINHMGRDQNLLHTVERSAELTGLAQMPEGHPEGWFLPETYVFTRGDKDIDLLRRAYAAMQFSLQKAWDERDDGLPYETPYELLTMASIVEKETSLAAERADIAGVFVRRLQQKWRLETDPTIIYGIGENFDGDIKTNDLRTDNPYNTYTRHGLPPSPISLPGVAALQAAAHPAEGEAMFFVASGQGGHTFSVTLEDHNKAVQQYLKVRANQSSTDPNSP